MVTELIGEDKIKEFIREGFRKEIRGAQTSVVAYADSISKYSVDHDKQIIKNHLKKLKESISTLEALMEQYENL